MGQAAPPAPGGGREYRERMEQRTELWVTTKFTGYYLFGALKASIRLILSKALTLNIPGVITDIES